MWSLDIASLAPSSTPFACGCLEWGSRSLSCGTKRLMSFLRGERHPAWATCFEPRSTNRTRSYAPQVAFRVRSLPRAKLCSRLYADTPSRLETNNEMRCADGTKPKEFGVRGSPVESIKLTGGEAHELFLAAGIDAAVDHCCHLCNKSTNCEAPRL